jgi:hypothetical protein
MVYGKIDNDIVLINIYGGQGTTFTWRVGMKKENDNTLHAPKLYSKIQ